MAQPNGTPDIPLGLTFDDVLLQPLESSVLPSQADTRTQLTRGIPLAHPDPVLGDGHGDRGRHGDRARPARRDRRPPPQHGRRGAGHCGPPGQALRKRDGGQSDHDDARPEPRRGARADEGQPHQRHPDRREIGQAVRHPHQPRRALRREPAPEGQRADDQRKSRHRSARDDRGRRAAHPPPAADREIAGGRQGQPLRRADHRQGHREIGRGAVRDQGRRGAAAGRRGDDRRRQPASPAPRR